MRDDAWKQVGPAELFDLAELYDAAGLDVVVESDQLQESLARPGSRVRKISLSFTSQEWHGMTWRHPVHIYAPEHEQGHGLAGIVATEAEFWTNPDHRRRTIPETGRSTEAEYAEGAALDLGLPVMIYATPPHLLGMNESDLNGYANKKLFETGDFTWYGYYPVAVSYLRAITLLQNLPGLGVRRAVLLGHSKRGLGAGILTGVDPERLAGIMTTGTNGMNMFEATARKVTQLGLDVAGPSIRRGGLGFQTAGDQMTMFNSALGFEAVKRFDPYFWRETITTPWFVVNGTNDPFFAVDVAQTMRHAHGPTTVLAVDNLTHTWVSQKVLAAWRMWLAHLAHGHDLPALEVRGERSARELVVTARAGGPATTVRLVTARNRGMDWRSAAWSMTRLHLEADGEYGGRIPLPPDENLAWYVEVQSGDPADPGFVSNAVKIEPACPPGE
ncbi:PhoPQ-activated protein PqaA family protein [Nonomuraea roseola]|uniref:PhoPQ-activated protein PqaA family protein n=1 Tax=Nonomuraea roseola TaxID=46179 RepID=A0ABV5PTJ8_9ACTN